MSDPNLTVYRCGHDLAEVLSAERSTCSRCGVDGWVGDWPDQGGLVADPGQAGELFCDPCAEPDRCRCGAVLPSVAEDEAPFEFCSESCKAQETYP